MYDYRPGLTIGDTLWMNNYNSYCPINQIDSVSFGLNRRARYWCTCDTNLNGYSPSYIIEGVGHNKGFNNFFDLCQDVPDQRNYMICAKFNGNTVLIDSTSTCGTPGHILVGIDEPELEEITLWWNQSTETMTLQGWDQNKEYRWTVYDLQGKIVGSGPFISDKIPVQGLSKGIYLFEVQTEMQRKAKRFINL
jgi:hypothetical protein